MLTLSGPCSDLIPKVYNQPLRQPPLYCVWSPSPQCSWQLDLESRASGSAQREKVPPTPTMCQRTMKGGRASVSPTSNEKDEAEGVDAEPAACLYEPNGWPVLTLRFRGKVEISGFLEKPEGGPYVGLTLRRIRWTGGAITLVHRAACPRTCPGASESALSYSGMS